MIPLSIMMFYFSGQNIGMLNGAGTPADNGQIWENFDNIYFRQTTILDYSLVENRTPSAFGLVAFGQVIYRDPLKTDPIPLGSYTNHFFFREYYLSKNCKMIFLRGFGILFNLPDDDKYLLKN
ncbi:MAG: hypothetical protein NT084_10625 [Bacteroidetes bacterium]|nr:hypothetical protein [Bacteroidota bacterium]